MPSCYFFEVMSRYESCMSAPKGYNNLSKKHEQQIFVDSKMTSYTKPEQKIPTSSESFRSRTPPIDSNQIAVILIVYLSLFRQVTNH
ncbi:hypothetical protein CAEBREN_28860 [Caenorhabditis brenneri]|uniref:Uncharacterized protein n=1 Tax=Caenorhabditis brenneri TaxID=135651 RepID=G0N8G2_CAEBE|nr:hypothetical protein CAEBREN_28860 [Caenorhabditis brenneri]